MLALSFQLYNTICLCAFLFDEEDFDLTSDYTRQTQYGLIRRLRGSEQVGLNRLRDEFNDHFGNYPLESHYSYESRHGFNNSSSIYNQPLERTPARRAFNERYGGFYEDITPSRRVSTLRYVEDNDFQPLERFSANINFENFYEATISACNGELSRNSQTRNILFSIYNNIGSNPEQLALFVSTSLHNTSYYTVFSDRSSSNKYRSRGLLMIQTKANYEKLSELSSYGTDYVNNPSCLSNVTNNVIEDTIEFWNNLMHGSNFTFTSMLNRLNVRDWKENHFEDQGITNWKNLYNRLKRSYARY